MDDAVRLGVLESIAGYRLRRASAVLANDFARAMAGTGLRQVLFGILSVIAANPEVNQGAVGAALGVKRTNMVGLINELIDAGLVARSVSRADRRAFTLALTGKGEALLGEAMERIREHEDRLLADLTAGERRTLLALLARVEAGGDELS